MKKLEEYVRSIPDFPQEGIIFRDVTSVLEDADGMHLAIDTMQDLLVNFIGAVLFSFFGYFCMKYKDKRKLLRKLVPRRKEKN